MMHETESTTVDTGNDAITRVSVWQKLANLAKRGWRWIFYKFERMLRWAAHYLKSFIATRAEVLKLQTALRSVQLDIDERDDVISKLRADIERERAARDVTTAAASDSALEKAMADLSLPIIQLATQMHLVEQQGRALNPKDVLTVLNRLVKNAANAGLSLEGTIGDVAAYDADRHEPILSEAAPAPGQPVTIRMPGAAFKGKFIRKAAVELIAK